ncbi:MAG: ATP-binding cassette domain-containing protein [Balneolia bacterium]|nr:ATP-binding cassette domain-containing protein [Balneolia bacterium]
MRILEFENLGVTRGRELLFRVESGAIESGQRIWLKAPNGSGKSTFIGIMCGTDLKYDGGLLSNSAIEPGKPAVCALLPEHSALNEKIRVSDLISGYQSVLDAHGRLIDTMPAYLQNELNIEELLKKSFGVLSKGERKRVMLSLCLMTRSDLLILDEAFDGLDENYRHIATKLIGETLSDNKKALVATSHTELPSTLKLTTVWEISNQQIMVSDYE